MANSYTNLLFHVVFSTKERRPLIRSSFQSDLYSYIGGIVRQEGGALIEIGGVSDHVHLVPRLRPGLALADLLRVVKAKSSKWANLRGSPGTFQWQRGYGAFSVSESKLADVVAYVRGQEEHHRLISFRDEYIKLLKRHGVAYDERYLF